MANTQTPNALKNFSQIGLGLLPVEDLEAYLRLKYKFIADKASAHDTENVAGIPSSNIAISVEGDRYTVQNAEQLGKRPSDEYMTVDDGARITNAFESIKDTYAQEVSDVRDELYQMRSELARKGYVSNIDLYKGMYESFSSSDILYHNRELFTVAAVTSGGKKVQAEADVSNIVYPGDWLVFKDRAGESSGGHITEVEAVEQGNIIVLKNAYTANVAVDNIAVTKTLGTYYNQSFGFLERKDFIPSSNVNHTTVDDDQFVKRLEIKENNTGVAYTFRFGIQSFSGDTDKYQGYLSDLKIRGSVQSETALNDNQLLTAYVVLEEDLPKFKNRNQALADGIVLAQSKPLVVKSRKNDNVFPFDFSTGETYPILSSHDPSSLEAIRYALIVVTHNEDGLEFASSKQAAIIFNTLYKKDDAGNELDLQTHNSLYRITEKRDDSLQSAFYKDADYSEKELYYVFGTREMMESDINPFSKGLYTYEKDLPDTMDVSYARVTMRIKREGAFEINPEGLKEMIAPGDTLRVKRDTSVDGSYDLNMIGGLGLSTRDEPIVIGRHIVSAHASSPTEIIVNTPSETSAGADVYRLGGYAIRLVAIYKEINEDVGGYVEKYRVARTLDPKTIVLDRNKQSEEITDRILFEAFFEDENGEPIKFNAYELQIIWQSPYSTSYLTDDKIKHQLYGGFSHLNLTLDATI